uniref:Protein kinase C n=1 Tax=Romanomermis culicivorax TaxID=13658 RepID=A0A915J3I2_ROMCU
MTRRRHYWVMDSTSITLYHNSDFQTATRFYKQIELASILGIQPYDGAPYDANTPPHCFEIVTKDLVYYVGENLEWYNHHNQQNKKSSTNGTGSCGLVIPRRESGLGKASAQRWLDAIRSALLPPSRLAFDLNSGPSSQTPEGMAELKQAQQVALEFSQLYQVFEHEELGCGQFGVVYGGIHRGSGRKIAVKVISKTRFGRKQKDQLRTEVAILQNISYAGIITLEAMFETKDRIFVVMEKMEADMLEMILSDRAGRLTE